MNRSSLIKEAEEEAHRFIRRCNEWRLMCSKNKIDKDSVYAYGNKESGAITRSSLDLTRALAAMRKG
jgi:hypothetical protein